MVQGTLSRFAGDTQLGVVADTPEHCSATQRPRDPDRLIKNESVCLMYQVIPLQRSPIEFCEILNIRNVSLKQMPI